MTGQAKLVTPAEGIEVGVLEGEAGNPLGSGIGRTRLRPFPLIGTQTE